MKYQIDTANSNRLSEFVKSLSSLQLIDPKNIKVNTNLTVLKYEDWLSFDYRKSRQYYDTLLRIKNIDPVIKSRMILNYATALDWRAYFRFRSKNKYLYPTVKNYIKRAKLDTEDSFELATYYAFFKDYSYAYSLAKKIIYRNHKIF